MSLVPVSGAYGDRRRDLPAEAGEQYGARGESCGEALLKFEAAVCVVAVRVWCAIIQSESRSDLANIVITRKELVSARDLPSNQTHHAFPLK